MPALRCWAVACIIAAIIVTPARLVLSGDILHTQQCRMYAECRLSQASQLRSLPGAAATAEASSFKLKVVRICTSFRCCLQWPLSKLAYGSQEALGNLIIGRVSTLQCCLNHHACPWYMSADIVKGLTPGDDLAAHMVLYTYVSNLTEIGTMTLEVDTHVSNLVAASQKELPSVLLYTLCSTL